MAKERRTHVLIYYVPHGRQYIITTPRLWMHANPHHFNNADPKDNQIEDYLTENYGFRKEEHISPVVLYNLSTNIPPSNGISFI